MRPIFKTWLTLCLLLPVTLYAADRDQPLPAGATGLTAKPQATVVTAAPTSVANADSKDPAEPASVSAKHTAKTTKTPVKVADKAKTTDKHSDKTVAKTKATDKASTRTVAKGKSTDKTVAKAKTDKHSDKTIAKTKATDKDTSKTVAKTKADKDASKTVAKTKTADKDASKTVAKTRTTDKDSKSLAKTKASDKNSAQTLAKAKSLAKPGSKKTPAPALASVKQSNKVVSRAVKQLGTPYRWGGTSPAGGFDCSGFVKYAFNDVKAVNLPHSSGAMAAGRGQKVNRQDLKPGDLLFFNTEGRKVDHVAIYLGNDKFIHAPREGKTVTIDNLKTPYWESHYALAKRVLPKDKTLHVAQR